MWKRENINIYLSTELVFLIITSLIVFTNQPLNWIVAILMFMHLIGIAWLVANPNNFYQMAEDSINLDEGCLLYTSPSPRDGLLSRMPSSA